MKYKYLDKILESVMNKKENTTEELELLRNVYDIYNIKQKHFDDYERLKDSFNFNHYLNMGGFLSADDYAFYKNNKRTD